VVDNVYYVNLLGINLISPPPATSPAEPFNSWGCSGEVFISPPPRGGGAELLPRLSAGGTGYGWKKSKQTKEGLRFLVRKCKDNQK